jgi:hypothetical protein
VGQILPRRYWKALVRSDHHNYACITVVEEIKFSHAIAVLECGDDVLSTPQRRVG